MLRNRKWAVTTVKPRKRYIPGDGELEDAELEARNNAKTTSICPSAVQKSACSCIYTCPGPSEKDKRKTVKTTETETEYIVCCSSRSQGLLVMTIQH